MRRRLPTLPLWLLLVAVCASCGQLAGWLGWTHGRPEKRGVRPARAITPSPATGATGVSVTPTLTCTGVRARRFDIWFGPTSGSLTKVQNLVPTCSYSPATLLVGHTYFWRVDSYNGYGVVTGTVWSFSTTAAAPGAPTVVTPASGATGVGRDPSLKATATGATSMNFYFGASTCTVQGGASPCAAVSGCQGISTGTGSTATCLLPTGTTVDSTTYNWQVRAINSAGNTDGALWSFTTGVTSPPGAVSNRLPAANATNVPLTATLSWTASGATNYDIYLGAGTLPSCAPPLLVSNHGSGGADTYAPAGLTASTAYCWKIVAKNTAGQTTSSILQFTTGTATRQLLAQSDLTYIGCYTVPGTISGATMGATRGLTGRYVAGAMHIIGAAETSVPAGVGGSVWEAAVPATYQLLFPCSGATTTGFVSYGEITTANWPAIAPGNALWLQGVNWDETGQVLYYSYGDTYYGSPINQPSFGRATLNYGTATMTVDALGDWQFPSPQYKAVMSCVLPIPSRWLTSIWPALNTAGQRLFAGCGAPLSVLASNDSSMGPSLHAFVPPTTSGVLPAPTSVLFYPFSQDVSSTTDRMNRPNLNQLPLDSDGNYPLTKWMSYDTHLPSLQLIDTTNRRGILGLTLYLADEGGYGPGGALGYADWRQYMFVLDPEDPAFANPTGPLYSTFAPQPAAQWAMQYKDPLGNGPYDYTTNPLAHVTKTITNIATTSCTTPLDPAWVCSDDWGDGLTVTAPGHGFFGSPIINGFYIANTTRGQWVNSYAWNGGGDTTTLTIATTKSKGGLSPYVPASDATPGAGAFITPLYIPGIRSAFGPMGAWFDPTSRQLHVATGDEGVTMTIMVYQIP